MNTYDKTNIYIYENGKFNLKHKNLNYKQIHKEIRKLLDIGIHPSKIVLTDEYDLLNRQMELSQ